MVSRALKNPFFRLFVHENKSEPTLTPSSYNTESENERMTLRRYYDERMDQIRSEIVRMGNLANDMIEVSIQAALTGNELQATEVIRRDDEVDFLEEEIIRNTVLLVMQEAPVASDLRMLTSTLGVIGELEKVADDAVKLARRATHLDHDFPGELRASLIEIGALARKSLAASIRLYTQYDPNLASEIVDGDENIDTQYAIASQRLSKMIQEQPEKVETFMKTLEIFHALEHIADRAVAIAKRLRVHYDDSSKSRLR